MYAQAAIKPNTLLRNGAYGIVMRGVQKCTCAGASLRDRNSAPLCCIKLDTATEPVSVSSCLAAPKIVGLRQGVKPWRFPCMPRILRRSWSSHQRAAHNTTYLFLTIITSTNLVCLYLFFFILIKVDAQALPSAPLSSRPLYSYPGFLCTHGFDYPTRSFVVN